MFLKTQTKLLVGGAVFAVAALLEFGAFALDRSLGGFTYLIVSVLLACLSVWLSCAIQSRLVSIAAASFLSVVLLAGNTYFADFVRNTLLRLGENFGQSAMAGIVLFIVILPLTVLATITTATVQLVVRDRS